MVHQRQRFPIPTRGTGVHAEQYDIVHAVCAANLDCNSNISILTIYNYNESKNRRKSWVFKENYSSATKSVLSSCEVTDFYWSGLFGIGPGRKAGAMCLNGDNHRRR